jgi:hypothetical protein
MPSPELERMFESREATDPPDGVEYAEPATEWHCRTCRRAWLVMGGLDLGTMNSLLAHGRSHEEKPKMQRLGVRK